ncbi:MAG: serine/threonine-protein kinase [Myxococcales bacterium]
MPPFVPSPLPQTFGKYTLLRSLGHGGTAEIFLARQKGRDEPVVIKRLLPELSEEVQFLAMLVGEAKVAALLDHPGIVHVHELGKEDNLIYLAMEYVRGWDLHALAKVVGGRIPPTIGARIAQGVAEALAHAHARTDLNGRPLNLVHRDVTPSNVMITTTGEVKLIDFGVAKAQTQLTFTQPGVVKGKFRYMSPEQIEQKALDGRSDLFALGVTLYEITTGERAFDRKQIVDILRAVLRFEPEPPSSVVAGYPSVLEAVVLKALQKDREQRYPDAAAMARDLREALKAMKGPTDVGAWARDLAARFPDKLRPPPELTPEPLEAPISVSQKKPKLAEFKPELTLVNLSESEQVPHEPTPEPVAAKWMTDPLKVKIAQPIGMAPPRQAASQETDPTGDWKDQTELEAEGDRNTDDEETVDGVWRDKTEPDPHWKEKTVPMPPPSPPLSGSMPAVAMRSTPPAPAAAPQPGLRSAPPSPGTSAPAIPLPKPPAHASAEPAWTSQVAQVPSFDSGPHPVPRRSSRIPAIIGLILLAISTGMLTWSLLEYVVKK